MLLCKHLMVYAHANFQSCKLGPSFVLNQQRITTVTRGRCYKTFYGRKLQIFVMSQSVRHSSLSRIVQCFQVRQEPTQVKHLLGAPLKGRLLALPTKNRLGQKGFPVANHLAYYINLQLTVVKSFITLAQGLLVPVL